jgi:CHASE2 domain-containing sensor protein
MFRVSYPHLLELKVLDLKFKIKQQYKSYTRKGQISVKKEKIIIVALNDDFLENDLISREKLAELLSLVSTKNPKVIGLDILLDKSREGDDALAEAIKSAGNVVLPFELKAGNSEKTPAIFLPLPGFAEFSEVGFANFSQHPVDGVVRELRPLRLNAGDRIYYPFSLQILRTFYAEQDIGDILGANPEKEGSLRIDFEEKEQFLILEPDQLERGAFKDFYYGDKIVLIGYWGEKQPHDSFLTPLSIRGQRMNGVVLQANILNTVYLKRYLRAWFILDVAITLSFASIGSYLHHRRKFRLLVLLSVFVLYSVMLLCLFIFTRIDIPLWAPILTMTMTAFFPQRKST